MGMGRVVCGFHDVITFFLVIQRFRRHCVHHQTKLILIIAIFIFVAMGMGLCVAFIAFVRLPSLKVSTLLLTGLLIYDVFWVFFSSYIFSANVMVKVCIASMRKLLNLFIIHKEVV